jgi:hypothetical protein
LRGDHAAIVTALIFATAGTMAVASSPQVIYERTVPGTLRPDQLVIGTTEPRARASQGWRPGCFQVNAPLASPISFTPMIRHKTVVITALRRPIQPLRLPHQVGRAW